MLNEDNWRLRDDNWYFVALFIVCLALHLNFSFVGWGNTICDVHCFRQTQTAISTYYLIKEGFKINYITPVLGKPWAIPMEFPLYQWIVAAFAIITKINLDQAGRFISLSFFYFSLIPLYYLLSLFIAKRAHILVFLCLVLASPVYIFWSRTFMIESLALFLNLTFLVAVVKTANKPGPNKMLIASVVGILAALSKITTFVVFCLPAALLFAWFSLRQNRQNAFSLRTLSRQAASACLLFGVPIILNIAWIIFADRQKSLNPMAADFITSGALKIWHFGRLSQRLSADVWDRVLSYGSVGTYETFVANFLISYGLLLLLAHKYRKQALWCFLFFIFGPLVLINLFWEHNYYSYASGLFFLLSLGFCIVSLLENDKWKVLTQVLILPLIILFLHRTYFLDFYPVQKRNNLSLQSLSRAVKAYTKENDVILIYGFDWSSALPYYSQRRALMDKWGLPFAERKFQLVLKQLGKDRITAMVIAGNKRSDGSFIEQRVKNLNLLPNPAYRDWFVDLYISADAGNRRDNKSH